MKKDAQVCSWMPPRVRAQPHLRLRGASVRKLIDAAFVHEKSFACPLAKVRYRTYLLPEDCQNASRRTSGPRALSEIPFLKSQSSPVDMFFHLERNTDMKKRRYIDLYGYTQDEFDHWLEKGINKKLRSAGKSRSELDMHTIFAAYHDETRKLPRRRFREMRTAT